MPEQLREQGDARGIADKACWTEPLFTRAKVASSMGIVKRNGATTRVVYEERAVRLKVSGEWLPAVGEFGAGDREREGAKAIGRGGKICAGSRLVERPETAGRKRPVMRIAVGR